MNAAPRPIRRALISVSDKTGLTPFASALAAQGVALISTGGSARALAEAGLKVTEIAAVTGFPEMLDGRVKTLHPAVHGGLLARRDRDDHAAALAAHNIAEIDLLVCNLYPFAATVASGAGRDDCIENIDIGGPALIRAAAKNHEFVAVVTDPGDYQAVLGEIALGGTSLPLRRSLARKAYAMTAAYDAAIATWFARDEGVTFPETITIAGRLVEETRYGENPHQQAAFYRTDDIRPGIVSPGIVPPGIATARQVQGKELSYNNYADTAAAFELVGEFAEPAVAIIKHANPCGAAIGDTLADAWEKALRCDPVSAFGGIVALNRRLDAATAEAIVRIFVEVVIAPDADPQALDILARKNALRLLLTGGVADPKAPGWQVRSVAGGLLVQERDTVSADRSILQVVTKRAPSEAEIADLLFADTVAKHVKSNAIVFARNGATVGIGAGQMSRVDSARIAALKAIDAAGAAGLAEPLTRGSVVASDAFYPFPDGLEAAIAAGATAAIQPGGSRRDAEIIAVADAAGIAMLFTGLRHFRH
ncbi:MAG TPA: bifunctional phosphoribosylaminoimidazolecarboxamide formyltransferase/IMP cyclohydrolase [Stellaceae bacterium]|jgi:phosphoribosylaminoimidazolecarboxamide formyltransferase/IMP cyclohydrolase|nr:bifunctional phosphoribosylaminoimidazolecarboxamide formyltransferase/IMP cyclohydrolase [Stellaceae bacterium]